VCGACVRSACNIDELTDSRSLSRVCIRKRQTFVFVRETHGDRKLLKKIAESRIARTSNHREKKRRCSRSRAPTYSAFAYDISATFNCEYHDRIRNARRSYSSRTPLIDKCICIKSIGGPKLTHSVARIRARNSCQIIVF